MNRLLERLATEYRTMSEQYDEILTRCDDDQRDPNDTESALLDGLRTKWNHSASG